MKKKKEEHSVEIKKKHPRFHLEMEGSLRGSTALVSNVSHIEAYSKSEIALRVSDAIMHLKGTGLSLLIFENKTVEVNGILMEVSFIYDRN